MRWLLIAIRALLIFSVLLTSLAQGATVPATTYYWGFEGMTSQSPDVIGKAQVDYYCNWPKIYTPELVYLYTECAYAGFTPATSSTPWSSYPWIVAGTAYANVVYAGTKQRPTFTIYLGYTCPDPQNLRFPNDSAPVCWVPDPVAKPQPSMQITAVAPTIPANSTTQSGKVLTKSNLTLRITQGGQPVSGMAVSLQSSRGALDVIDGPTATTNASGTTVAAVSTRAQPGQSTISGSSPSNLQTATPASISWLPARYESLFLVTCYTLAVEAEAVATPVSHNVCGLPSANQYRSKFLTDVKMQGSGQALDGSIVHYSGQGCFNIDSCARTATGACATVGTTIAVDRSVIPRGSTVTVDILGQRKAQDGGGWINGYHIDDYMGPQRAACLQLGHRNSGIVFQNY